jgi:excisionase family DNA binding protein
MENGIRMSENMQPKEVLSVKDLAQYLGLSESKVRQLIRRNAIPYVKLDGSYRFFLPTVQDWLRQKSAQPQAVPDGENALTLANRIWNNSVGE